ncbi:multicopper oxidase family protein [Sorangium cellulosum]|uniref:multicopper oxidase family protein n=1 Tax=Sorangium cellulosum TaxID=56 RepID=UPI001F5E2E56|nr:multicopper oxidase family protein [Sorangium cellulosum]
MILLGGCGDEEEPPDLRQPAGWDDALRLPDAEDHDPAPDVVEVHLEARVVALEVVPGLMTEVWTYNGMLPGPTIRARRGDRVVVKFENHLPEATTVHWHGLRVPAAMDGTEHMQKPIEPGEGFEYSFIVPDAGTFWYHPHLRSSAQVGAGLYGAFVVEEAAEEAPLGDELLLVMSDIDIEEDGSLGPSDSSGWFGDYFGREGSTVLVNGKILPTVAARAGVPQRWRVVNAARARYFRFAVPGQPLVQIGGDGGLLESPLPVDDVTLVPGERAELYMLPVEGESVVIPRLDANRFHLPKVEEPGDLMRLELVDEPPGHGAPPLPARLAEIASIDTAGARGQPVEFMEQGDPGGAVLGINGQTDGSLTLSAQTNTVEIWTLTNATNYDHPFHLHGFSFQVLDIDGVAPPVRAWHDTINTVPGETLRIAIPFDDRAGMWMFHCHILDHADLGMMAMLHLMP